MRVSYKDNQNIIEVSAVYGAYLVKSQAELTEWGDNIADYHPQYPVRYITRARSLKLYFEPKNGRGTFYIQTPPTIKLIGVCVSEDDKPILSDNFYANNIDRQSIRITYYPSKNIVQLWTSLRVNNIGFNFSAANDNQREISQDEVDAIKVRHNAGVSELASFLSKKSNPWFNKTYAALGDSITYGFIPRNYHGYPGRLRSYARIAAGNLGMDFYNYGISGDFLAHNNTITGMCKRYESMVDTADLVTFMGGTNDVRNNIPLGKFTDRIPTTYYGALHTLMQGLYMKYIASVPPIVGCSKRIVAITPIKLLNKDKSNTYDSIENNTDALFCWPRWIDAIKEVASFYSIPVFDAYNLSGINPHLCRTVHGTDLEYKGNYNPYITDGTHPTQEGQQMLGDALTGFLKDLK